MFEKYVYLTLINGGQEKEDFKDLKICIVKILLLSPHRGDVAITCLVHCLVWVFHLLVAPMMHPRHQPFKWEGVYI